MRPLPTNKDEYTISPIGYVVNEHDESKPAPQIAATESRIVVFPEYELGLDGLDKSDRVMVLFYFSRAGEPEMLQHPRGDKSRPKRGVFALHSPRRPNHIGVTVADIISIEGNVMHVRGLDALNGTPVVDLKSA